MTEQNCWEFKKCGREKVNDLGVCPAATFTMADGFCDGLNGGRACVYITGTFCAGIVQGTHREKEKDCAKCGFYKTLKQEYGAKMTVLSFSKYVKAREEWQR